MGRSADKGQRAEGVRMTKRSQSDGGHGPRVSQPEIAAVGEVCLRLRPPASGLAALQTRGTRRTERARYQFGGPKPIRKTGQLLADQAVRADFDSWKLSEAKPFCQAELQCA